MTTDEPQQASEGENANGTHELVELFDDINSAKKEESRRPGVFTVLAKNPLMVMGMGATSYFLFKGIRAVSAGEHMELSRALQGRVIAQFGTLMIVIATGMYVGMTSKDRIAQNAIDNERMIQQAVRNFQDAQNK